MLQMMRSCCPYQCMTSCWTGLQGECKEAGMRISTFKSKAMVLSRKGGLSSPDQGGDAVPNGEFKCLRVLFPSEGKVEQDRCGVHSDAGSAPVSCGEEGAELKCKALDLLVNLCAYPCL